MKPGKILRALLAVSTLLFGIMITSASATEVVMSVEEVFEKTVDNVIVLFDSSSSMAKKYGDTNMTRLEAEREVLNQANMTLPDLDWNMGFYSFTPKAWHSGADIEISPMAPYSKDSVAKAIAALPAKASGPTLLQHGLEKIEPVLAGLKGKTAIMVFTDGTYTKMKNSKDTPLTLAQRLEEKYDVCIYAVSSATGEKEKALIKAMTELNDCSMVIPFNDLLGNPGYTTGALYQVKQKIVSIDIVDDIFFEFNKYDLQPQYKEKVALLGEFLQKHPGVRVTFAGYTDGIGSEGYNMGLSRKRAASVAASLLSAVAIDPNRITLQWYGKADPIATNDTKVGRALNRRVSVILTAIKE